MFDTVGEATQSICSPYPSIRQDLQTKTWRRPNAQNRCATVDLNEIGSFRSFGEGAQRGPARFSVQSATVRGSNWAYYLPVASQLSTISNG